MSESTALSKILQKEHSTISERLNVVFRLNLPGMLAQVTEIMMQYIDAAMAGSLGAAASASIGLVASSTWFMGSFIWSSSAGFSVQVAHAIGARNYTKARSILRQAMLISFCFSLGIALFGILISMKLPQWLGAEQSLWYNAKMYFMIFCIFLPVRELNSLAHSMLQCSGNMKTPSIISAMTCFLDVIFNYFLIFPARDVTLLGMDIHMPGAGLGVIGAQLGTSLAILVASFFTLYNCLVKSPVLSITKEKGSWKPQKSVMSEALHIGLPMLLEQAGSSLAQIAQTRIIAPLGTIAIAANSFAITAESICYMPGYGTGSAATTLVGQSIGAERKDLARGFAWLTTFFGMAIMTVMAILMFFASPAVFRFLTPVAEVQKLGVEVLRIELLAEPLFGASIVATGALRGAGDTLVPGLMSIFSIWGVRIVMAMILTKSMGLYGAWIAMATQLCVLGIVLLIRLKREKWLKNLA
ncbi:MAG: MATE family efflux transporter [Solobacterium sp.]|nr:MATE family efflux transporter [Solobacterium sp.]